MFKKHLFGTVLAAVSVTGCNGGDGGADSGGTESGPASCTPDDDGREGCPCTSDGGCDEGLTCISDFCVAPADPSCGDGLLQSGEECDQGAANDDEGLCKIDCTLQVCGDGFVGPGEACDDGNTNGGDACTPMCALPTCGNGTVEGLEECDDGNKDDSDDCTSACLNAACGDGFLQADVEACDDGNGVDDDGCSNACKLQPTCGDGLIAQNELCFLPPFGLTVFGGPVDVEIADVADAGVEGVPDILVTVEDPGEVRILAGNGDGAFVEVSRFATGSGAADSVLGQFNNDGTLDIATANTTANTVTVLFGLDPGNNDGLFAQAETFNNTVAPGLNLAAPLAVAAGDLDGDGTDDVGIANFNQFNSVTYFSLLFGAASVDAMEGAATSVSLTSDNGGPNGAGFGLIDGSDGAFVVSERLQNRIRVIGAGGGKNGVISNSYTLAPNTHPRRLAVGDLDLDGADDVVFGTWHQPTCDYVDNPNVCSGNDGKAYFGIPGTEGLEDLTNVKLGKAPVDAAIADFNNDGKVDIAWVTSHSDVVQITVTDGKRNIGSPVSLAIDGATPISITTGDLNLDGLPDIVTTQSYTNNISILLSNP